jgi:hypothetical protein
MPGVTSKVAFGNEVVLAIGQDARRFGSMSAGLRFSRTGGALAFAGTQVRTRNGIDLNLFASGPWFKGSYN